MGKKVYLVTNNNQTSREEMAAKCRKMNFDLDVSSMIAASNVTARYLKHIGFNKKAFVIGSKVLNDEIIDVGIETVGWGKDSMEGALSHFVVKALKSMDSEVGVVVVGFDENLSYPKIFKAVNYLKNPEVKFIATNSDQSIDFPSFTFPDTGPIIAAIENATGRKATVVGKPNQVLAEIALEHEAHRDSRRILVIGDRMNTDILFGNNCKFQTLLVTGTGVHKLEDVEATLEKLEKGEGDEEMAKHIPDFYISKMKNLFSKA